MIQELYFATIDNNIVFANDIVKSHFLNTGEKIDHTDVDKIRLVAASMPGVSRELKKPSPVFLVRNGHTVAAVRVYRDLYGCTLSEARLMVEKIRMELEKDAVQY